MQTQTIKISPNLKTTWVSKNRATVKSSEYLPSIRYFIVNGFETYDDEVLGEKVRVISAVGTWQDEKLNYATNEDSVIIVETKYGYEYCGITRNGARSTIYIDHLGIELQNVEIMPIQCHQSDIQAIMQQIREHGFTTMSAIMNPWTSIVPYVINVLLRLGYNIEFGE